MNNPDPWVRQREINKKFTNIKLQQLRNKKKALMNEFQKPKSLLAPATGQTMNTQGIQEIGDFDNFSNLGGKIWTAKLNSNNKNRNKAIFGSYTEQGNVRFPKNYAYHTRYGYSPENFTRKTTFSKLGRTAVRPTLSGNAGENFVTKFMYGRRKGEAVVEVLTAIEDLAKMPTTSPEYASQAETVKHYIYRLLDSMGPQYNAKSRADELLSKFLKLYEDTSKGRKRQELVKKTFWSVIPQDQSALNADLKAYTAVEMETNPMFASTGGSQFNNAWHAITSGNSSAFNTKYATRKRKNRKSNTRRRR